MTHQQIEVVSQLVLVVDTAILLFSLPDIVAAMFMVGLLPFMLLVGGLDMALESAMLWPFIVYGLVSLWWLVLRTGRPGFGGIPRTVQVGLLTAALVAVRFVVPWLDMRCSAAPGTQAPSIVDLVGACALCTLLVLGMQLHLVRGHSAPGCPGGDDDHAPDG